MHAMGHQPLLVAHVGVCFLAIPKYPIGSLFFFKKKIQAADANNHTDRGGRAALIDKLFRALGALMGDDRCTAP